jgi:hypothetical protein
MAAMPGAYCCKGQADHRIAPEHFEASQHDPSNLQVQHSISQCSDSGFPRVQPPRKKALAVATGYKYAEDMDGRPVVIVPGTRKSPIDLTSYAAIAQLRQYQVGPRRIAPSTTTTAPRVRRLPDSGTQRNLGFKASQRSDEVVPASDKTQ